MRSLITPRYKKIEGNTNDIKKCKISNHFIKNLKRKKTKGWSYVYLYMYIRQLIQWRKH